jgi:hypothetical protein
MRHPRVTAIFLLVFGAGGVRAEAPVASYIFPAGGHRGSTVNVRIGGLFLNKTCSFEILGPGVEASKQLHRSRTLWFEGPLLAIPESQQAEDYPKDMAGRVSIRPDAPTGIRYWRLWTSQGVTPARKFMVGDLPEVIEEEIDGDPIPVEVTLPVTINGRIFPREDVDLWTFAARKGQAVRCEVHAVRLGSPLDAHLEVFDPAGRRLVENVAAAGTDPVLHFTAPSDGKYQVRIRDVRMQGGQAFVYRLTISADPFVERTYPLGGRRGHKTRFVLFGQGLPADTVEIALPADGPRDYLHLLHVSGKNTVGFLLDLDDLDEFRESGPNETLAQVQPLPVPAVFNGQIEKPGDVDHWAWKARKGDVFELELRAARLGSPLDGVLTVLDGAGKELTQAAGANAERPDPVLRFQAPAEGIYYARVRDRFRTRGGSDFAYRLRVAPPAGPNFQLRFSTDALTVPRGGQARFKLLAERQGGFAGPIPLEIDGLPSDLTVSPQTIAAGQGAVDLTFRAEKNAVFAVSRLRIRGKATVDGKSVTRTAELPAARGAPVLDAVLLAVALPTPFKIKGDYQMQWVARGTMYERRYKIDRGGYDGPIEVSLTDRQARHLQGVTGPTIVVPPGATEFTYPVQLPPWMETGRTSRACVMGVGVIKDADGREREVSFSSTGQNEQLVAVVEPCPLGVEPGRSSLAAEPGGSVALPVRVARGKDLSGPVRVELIVPPHMRGVAADAVVIPANKEQGQLAIHFAAGPLGPFNMPVTVRATLTEKGRPITAETKVVILPDAVQTSKPLSLHPDNPHYFLFQGKPTVLITSAEHYGAVLNRDFDFVKYLDELQTHHLNLTRTFTGAYAEHNKAFNITRNTLAPADGKLISPWARSDTPGYAAGGNKFDLTRWDAAYFARLKHFLAEADKRGVVVELNLFCPFYEDSMWRLSPMNATNNVDGVGKVARDAVYNRQKNGDLQAVQESMVKKLVAELNGFDNLYYEVCNEPYFGGVTEDWQRRIVDVIVETEKALPKRHLISQNIANGSKKVENPHTAVSIFNFHYASPPSAVGQNYGLNKVIGDNETGFKGTADAHYRREGWDFILAGGGLYNHLDYSFAVGHEDGTFGYPPKTPGGGNRGFRRQMKVLSDFIHGFEFVRMRPDSQVVKGGLPAKGQVRVLSEPGKQYALYQFGVPSARLELALPAGEYRAEWVDPSNGNVLKTERRSATGPVTVVESPEFRTDVALRIVWAE